MSQKFQQDFDRFQNKHSSAFFLFLAANRWFSLRSLFCLDVYFILVILLSLTLRDGKMESAFYTDKLLPLLVFFVTWTVIALFRSPETLRWSIAMGWRTSWYVVFRVITSSSQELLHQSLPNLVFSICRVRRWDISNFLTPTPREENFGVKSVKLMYFPKNLLLYSPHGSDKLWWPRKGLTKL